MGFWWACVGPMVGLWCAYGGLVVGLCWAYGGMGWACGGMGLVVIVMTSRLVFPGGVMIVPANAGWRAIPPDDCPCTCRVHASAQNVDVAIWPDDSPCTRRMANLPLHIPGARVRPESRRGDVCTSAPPRQHNTHIQHPRFQHLI